MQSKLRGNVVHHGVELLLLVSMLFLLAIPKSPLILKEFLYTSFCIYTPSPVTSRQNSGRSDMYVHTCMGVYTLAFACIGHRLSQQRVSDIISY